MAATLPSESRLFGVDLAQWPAQWRAAGALLLGLPGLRALAPAATVQCHGPDGSRALWLLRHGIATPASSGMPDTQAVVLPRAAVLERHLTLPQLSSADLAHAVQLEVSACSPFPADQTVHGFTAQVRDGAAHIHLALTARTQCEAALSRAGLGEDAELWLEPASTPAAGWQPLVLRGWGEAARQRRMQQGQLRQLLWLLALLALLLALLVTPTAFKRQQALQAQAALDQLQRQAAPQMAQREALGLRLDSLRILNELGARQLALLPVMDMLTQAIPDGAWLTSLRVEGDKLVLNGMADDAAALVRRLAAQPGVSGVRLASPATRGMGEAKERFVIELNAHAAQYGVFQMPAAAASEPAAGELAP